MTDKKQLIEKVIKEITFGIYPQNKYCEFVHDKLESILSDFADELLKTECKHEWIAIMNGTVVMKIVCDICKENFKITKRLQMPDLDILMDEIQPPPEDLG